MNVPSAGLIALVAFLTVSVSPARSAAPSMPITVARIDETVAREPWSGNIFIVRWRDRSLKADAYVRFTQSFDRAVEGMTLKPVSPATDFSFDFEDLDFRKAQPRME